MNGAAQTQVPPATVPQTMNLNVPLPPPKPPSDEEFERMAEECPLMTPKEYANEYALSRKAMMQQCPGVMSLEQELFQIQSKYQQYVQMQQEKQMMQQELASLPPGAPPPPTTSGYMGQPKLMEIQSAATTLLQSMEEFKCPNKKSAADYLAATLPALSLISPPGAFIAGNGLSLVRTLNSTFKKHHLDKTGKLALCTTNKLMQRARSQECREAAFDGAFTWNDPQKYPGSKYFTLRDMEASIREGQTELEMTGGKTQTYKLMQSYGALEQSVASLKVDDPNEDSANKALKNIQDMRAILCQATDAQDQTKTACNVLKNMQAELSVMTTDDPDLDKVNTAISKLKINIKRLNYFASNLVPIPKEKPPEDPVALSKYIAFYQSQPSGVPGENAQTASLGIGAYYSKHDEVIQASMNIFTDPSHGQESSKNLLNLAIDNLPENMQESDINENMCEMTRCIWDQASPKDIFFKPGTLDSWKNWKFQSNQTLKSISDASGMAGEALLQKTGKNKTLQKLTDTCQKMSGKIIGKGSLCTVSCNPVTDFLIPGKSGVGMAFGMPVPANPPAKDSKDSDGTNPSTPQRATIP